MNNSLRHDTLPLHTVFYFDCISIGYDAYFHPLRKKWSLCLNGSMKK